MPVMRCATSVRTECSVRRGSRWSVKPSATRSKSPVERSASLRSSAPAFDVIDPPSNAAVTLRHWHP